MSETGIILNFCNRLGKSHIDLALYLDIIGRERDRWERGRECEGILDWLHNRDRLQELKEALVEIKREDLVDLSEDLVDLIPRLQWGQDKKSGTSPQSIPQNLKRTGAKHFVGRDEAMNTLHQQLQARERVAITSITGMGGIGKTELALQYAHYRLQQQTYSGGVCWLQARGKDVGNNILNFAISQLNLTLPEDGNLNVRVSYCWRNWQAGEVLVIFDDVVDYGEIKDFLPPAEPRFKVLITTRERLGAPIVQLDLKVLKPRAAMKLLESLVGRERLKQEPWMARKLCRWLGYLPLGLELVGRYLELEEDLCLSEMLKQLESASLEDESLEEAEPPMTGKRGVKAAFELSWQQLSENSQALARLLGLFAPASIHWSLVENAASDRKAKDLRKDRRELVKLSLVKRKYKDTYELHPLIREFFRGKLPESNSLEEMKRAVCRVVVAEARKIPDTPTRENILGFEPAIPHIAEVANNLTDWLTDEDLIWPFVGLGRFYEGQGLYDRAEPWREQCRAISQSCLGSAHPDVATSLNNLAALYYYQGRYDQAEPLYREALEIQKQLLGSVHPHVALSLNNLAALYDSQGRYDQAEPLYREALEMRKQLLGSTHSDMAQSLHNLAGLYKSQGRYDQAEPLLAQALEMHKQLLGSAHPHVATNLNNLANLYSYQGRYDQAEPLLAQALDMYKQLLGSPHPHVATSLNNLANLYFYQRRYDQAEPLCREALEMRKQLLGSPHPDIAQSLNNLAFLYYSQGRYDQAEPLYKEALEMYKQLLGSPHPDVATSLNNLAFLYYSQGRYDQAEPLLAQALEITEQRLGQEHPDTQTVQQNYRAFLQKVQI